MKLWRIATETRLYSATDLSGAGAAKYPGRWNDDGEPVVYAAISIALATLETAAHVDRGGLPLNRYLIEIEVPDNVWSSRTQFIVSSLPSAWNAVPAGMASVRVGSQWLQSGRTAVASVPSVIVPEDFVALINPRHPDAARVSAISLRRFEFDALFRAQKLLPLSGDWRKWTHATMQHSSPGNIYAPVHHPPRHTRLPALLHSEGGRAGSQQSESDRHPVTRQMPPNASAGKDSYLWKD